MSKYGQNFNINVLKLIIECFDTMSNTCMKYVAEIHFIPQGR